MILATCSNARWLPRIKPYLETLDHYSELDNVLLGVHCAVPDAFMRGLPSVRAVSLPVDVLDGTPDETQSVQHGSWLAHVPGHDEQTVIFTDGDIRLQRAFTPGELTWLSEFPADTICAGWNSGPGETLLVESRRLFPRVSEDELALVWGGQIREWRCYNIGVMVLQRATYARIYARYMELWPRACASFAGPARQQWAFCYVAHELGLMWELMPYALHTHGCYALPDGASLADGSLRYHGELVAFRHHV